MTSLVTDSMVLLPTRPSWKQGGWFCSMRTALTWIARVCW